MKKLYQVPELEIRDLKLDQYFLVASGGQVGSSSFEGNWDTGEEELDY